MQSEQNWEEYLSLQTPATYMVRVQGELDGMWSDRLGGMRITSSKQRSKGSVSTLIGWLRDQAELMGVLISTKCTFCF